MSVRYQHIRTGFIGTVEWDDGHNVGIDCPGLTWTGSVEQFQAEWIELQEGV